MNELAWFKEWGWAIAWPLAVLLILYWTYEQGRRSR